MGGHSPDRQRSWGDPSRNRQADRSYFHPLLPSVNTLLSEGTSIPNMLNIKPCPLCFGRSTLSSHTCLSPCSAEPLSQKTCTNLASTISDPHHLLGLSSGSDGGRANFVSRSRHILLKCTPANQGQNTACKCELVQPL